MTLLNVAGRVQICNAKATRDVWGVDGRAGGRREEINKINPGREKKEKEKKKSQREKMQRHLKNNPALMFMHFQI